MTMSTAPASTLIDTSPPEVWIEYCVWAGPQMLKGYTAAGLADYALQLHIVAALTTVTMEALVDV